MHRSMSRSNNGGGAADHHHPPHQQSQQQQLPPPPPPQQQQQHGFRFHSLEHLCRSLGARHCIRRLLIANNGLAAVKGIDSIRSWLYEHLGDAEAVQFVVMASAEDLKANAEFISMADSHVVVPGGPNSNNYANVDVIIKTARQQSCDAIYPGWGHASENPALPRACALQSCSRGGSAAGGGSRSSSATTTTTTMTGSPLLFLGPHEDAMFTLGDKIASTIVAQSNGVPTVPWSGSEIRLPAGVMHVDARVYDLAYVTRVEECELVCARVGFPVMLKASEGGGGKGIRCCTEAGQVRAMFEAVQEEVKGCHIFVMRMLHRVRHVEVQLLADDYDCCIAVHTRDCSVQRRHQKIIEEGPAYAIPAAVVRAMEQSAVGLARAVHYRGLGTVEYMYDMSTETFYFLELNPRLQVEHPVSELISGLNLPAALLCVGMGIPLDAIPEVRVMFGEPAYFEPDAEYDAYFPAVSQTSTPGGHERVHGGSDAHRGNERHMEAIRTSHADQGEEENAGEAHPPPAAVRRRRGVLMPGWLHLNERTAAPPRNHTIAVRITSEDTDDGFRPTSGRVEEILFRNSKECWGYFSIGPGGEIHAYADSQFGHLFCSGATREEARRTMIFALRSLVIRGEIRTSSGYLVHLLESHTFRAGEVTTNWLDELIAAQRAAAANAHASHRIAAVLAAHQTASAHASSSLTAAAAAAATGGCDHTLLPAAASAAAADASSSAASSPSGSNAPSTLEDHHTSRHGDTHRSMLPAPSPSIASVVAMMPDCRVYEALIAAALARYVRQLTQRRARYCSLLTAGHTPAVGDYLDNDATESYVHQGWIYAITVGRVAANVCHLTLNQSSVHVPFRRLKSGALQITLRGRTVVAYVAEDTNSIRITIAGQVITFTGDSDPNCIVATVPGRLVRYVIADGAHVTESATVAEVEVMKMILPLRSSASGILHHCAVPGSTLSVGTTLAMVTPADEDADDGGDEKERTDGGDEKERTDGHRTSRSETSGGDRRRRPPLSSSSSFSSRARPVTTPWPEDLTTTTTAGVTRYERLDGVARARRGGMALWDMLCGWHMSSGPAMSSAEERVRSALEELSSLFLSSVTLSAVGLPFLPPHTHDPDPDPDAAQTNGSTTTTTTHRTARAKSTPCGDATIRESYYRLTIPSAKMAVVLDALVARYVAMERVFDQRTRQDALERLRRLYGVGDAHEESRKNHSSSSGGGGGGGGGGGATRSRKEGTTTAGTNHVNDRNDKSPPPDDDDDEQEEEAGNDVSESAQHRDLLEGDNGIGHDGDVLYEDPTANRAAESVYAVDFAHAQPCHHAVVRGICAYLEKNSVLLRMMPATLHRLLALHSPHVYGPLLLQVRYLLRQCDQPSFTERKAAFARGLEQGQLDDLIASSYGYDVLCSLMFDREQPHLTPVCLELFVRREHFAESAITSLDIYQLGGSWYASYRYEPLAGESADTPHAAAAAAACSPIAASAACSPTVPTHPAVIPTIASAMEGTASSSLHYSRAGRSGRGRVMLFENEATFLSSLPYALRFAFTASADGNELTCHTTNNSDSDSNSDNSSSSSSSSNTCVIIVAASEQSTQEGMARVCAEALRANAPALRDRHAMESVCVVVHGMSEGPHIFNFRRDCDYAEDRLMRHVLPRSARRLELDRLCHYTVSMYPTTYKDVHIFRASPRVRSDKSTSTRSGTARANDAANHRNQAANNTTSRDIAPPHHPHHRDGNRSTSHPTDAAGGVDPNACRLFARVAVTPHDMNLPRWTAVTEIDAGHMLATCVAALEVAHADSSLPYPRNNHIFIKMMELTVEWGQLHDLIRAAARSYTAQLQALWVTEVELAFSLRSGTETAVRVRVCSEDGFNVSTTVCVEEGGVSYTLPYHRLPKSGPTTSSSSSSSSSRAQIVSSPTRNSGRNDNEVCHGNNNNNNTNTTTTNRSSNNSDHTTKNDANDSETSATKSGSSMDMDCHKDSVIRDATTVSSDAHALAEAAQPIRPYSSLSLPLFPSSSSLQPYPVLTCTQVRRLQARAAHTLYVHDWPALLSAVARREWRAMRRGGGGGGPEPTMEEAGEDRKRAMDAQTTPLRFVQLALQPDRPSLLQRVGAIQSAVLSVAETEAAASAQGECGMVVWLAEYRPARYAATADDEEDTSGGTKEKVPVWPWDEEVEAMDALNVPPAEWYKTDTASDETSRPGHEPTMHGMSDTVPRIHTDPRTMSAMDGDGGGDNRREKSMTETALAANRTRRYFVLVANDITYQSGSFSLAEDDTFAAASALARREGIPFVYLSANSGARIGLCTEVQRRFRVAVRGGAVDYLYLTPDDYAVLQDKRIRVAVTPIRVPTNHNTHANNCDDGDDGDGDDATNNTTNMEDTGTGHTNSIPEKDLHDTTSRATIETATSRRADTDDPHATSTDAATPCSTSHDDRGDRGGGGGGEGELRYRLDGVIGAATEYLGVENLRGSGLVAGHMSRNYSEIPTLSVVSGRSVGIGAYLNRLGRRVIQIADSPLILTGHAALNRLLGRDVYADNTQLGGRQVMVPNGVTHWNAQDELDAVRMMLRWLDYTPARVPTPERTAWMSRYLHTRSMSRHRHGSASPTDSTSRTPHEVAGLGGTRRHLITGEPPHAVRCPAPSLPRLCGTSLLPPRRLRWPQDDPIDRDVTFTPPCQPGATYDPRLLITGDAHTRGLFDRHSWTESLDGWAKTVITGRATLGGIPCGVILVETRLTKRHNPADPADPLSTASFVAQAGQVWFPDSARKTADTLDDFAREQLACFVLANWRGFSAGMRDMFDEVLKFGASIVDNLRVYRAPVFIYIPPGGELRGGAWVVIDPVINHEGAVEMYCDDATRGGVLEASAVAEIKFRAAAQRSLAERLTIDDDDDDDDDDAAPPHPHTRTTTTTTTTTNRHHRRTARATSAHAELCTDAAVRFADLHDTPARMTGTGVVHSVIPWRDSRRLLYAKLCRKYTELAVAQTMVQCGVVATRAEAVRRIVEDYHARGEGRRVAAQTPGSGGGGAEKDVGVARWGGADDAQRAWLMRHARRLCGADEPPPPPPPPRAEQAPVEASSPRHHDDDDDDSTAARAGWSTASAALQSAWQRCRVACGEEAVPCVAELFDSDPSLAAAAAAVLRAREGHKRAVEDMDGDCNKKRHDTDE